FPKLEWLYWRNADPDFASVDSLIRSLEEKPQERRLQAAPEAVDLAVLKRLAQDPALSRLADTSGKVRLLWEAACIPDFRKVGADHQARFIASLWPHLAGGNHKIPHARMAQEIARLENVQGDIATLGARIAAARTWTYIAQKSHWVEQPEAMIDRTRALESRLSDAMHALLTQRFVDKRTRVLMRGLLKDTLPQDVVVDDDGQVLVEGQEIGTLKGFQFLVPSDSRREDRKMLLAAAERYLGRIMTDNADALAKAPDSVLALVPDATGQPTIMWGDSRLAVLSKGKTLLQPEIKFERSIKDMAADDSQKVIDRVKAWVDAMKAKHLQGLVKIDALANEPETPAAVRALFAQIVDAGGILSRREIDQAVRALDNDMRGHARRAGLVFGALDIFHHALMKPGAVLWRTALFAAYDAEPMIDQAPDNAVHLKQGTFAAADHAVRLGFRKIGDEYVRVDMVERLIKQAHEARQQGDIFSVDPALATSLGLSQACHEALLALAGFVKTDDQPAPGEPLETAASESSMVPQVSADETAAVAEVAAASDAAPAVAEPPAETSTAVVAEPEAATEAVQYWRWKGMARKKQGGHFKPREKHQKRPKGAPVKRKVEPVLATAGGAFAELAALRDSMKK
ncbi:MAG: helicase, partial [Sphingomonadales bacterium CG_4_10_14_3_um_filter_58_15]